MAAEIVKTFAEVEREAVDRLAETGIADPVRDVSLLLQAASNLNRTQLVLKAADNCPPKVSQELDRFLNRRTDHVPTYRILGKREFHGLTLCLGPATLEPRDDTEALVGLCLDQIDDRQAELTFLDLGTGTGAVALALLSELPNAVATVTDISAEALYVAQANAADLGFASRFSALESNWYENVTGCFDFIVSNPPYIPSLVVNTLEPEVLEHDPRLALDGGQDGLDAYRSIFVSASAHLKQSGFLAVEIGYDQKQSVSELGRQGGFAPPVATTDLTGNDRALAFKIAQG